MSEFGDAAGVTPEINYTLMISGDLGESLIQAAAAYEALADMLMAELTAMGLNTSTTATVGWLGPGGVMMQMSAAEFIAVCAAVSAWVRIAQTQAGEVAAAHSYAVGSMIPAEVSFTNRATQSGLIATNFIGQNTPAIVGLEEQYIQYWITNAIARTGFGSVVSAALGAISEPGPFSPTAANPAGPLAAVAQAAGQDGAQAGLQTSAKTLTQAADAPAKDAMSGSGPGSIMSSLAGQAGGLFGQVGSAFGQFASTGQQLPSMLGQAPQMFSGLLGPLSSSMSGLNGASTATLATEAVGAGGVPMSVGGLGALAGGGGGGGGLVSGSSALSTTFVRPASSFSAPTAPTLPGGWQGSPESEAASQARPAGMGGGGLYGAPAAMGREADSGAEKSTRTMQVTPRPGANRGERQRI